MSKLLNPFEDAYTEVKFYYNKDFNGLDMDKIKTIVSKYRQTHSPEIKKSMEEFLGKEKTRFFIKEFVEDVDRKTKYVNKFSVVDRPDEISTLRTICSELILNYDKIRGIT